MATEKIEKAEAIVKHHMLLAAGAGYIPVPFIDYLGATAVQIKMIQELADLYEDETHSDKWIRRIVATLTSGFVGRAGGYLLMGGLKMLPFVGTAVAGTGLAIAHGASTYALGRIVYGHYEHGGTIADLDPSDYVEQFEDLFRSKSKDMAAGTPKEAAPVNP